MGETTVLAARIAISFSTFGVGSRETSVPEGNDILLIATSLPFHSPLWTTPKFPRPITLPNFNSSISMCAAIWLHIYWVIVNNNCMYIPSVSNSVSVEEIMYTYSYNYCMNIKEGIRSNNLRCSDSADQSNTVEVVTMSCRISNIVVYDNLLELSCP